MRKYSVTFKKLIFLALTCATVLVGCSSQFAASMRKVTYAPDFKYTEQSVLRSDMDQLAQQMSLLELALIKPYGETPEEIEAQREQVLLALKNMSAIASKLRGGNAGANHPFMETYMQDFISRIDKARTAASLQEPRYFFAGKVSGGCTSCHKVNR
jgi:hypothetical protein